MAQLQADQARKTGRHVDRPRHGPCEPRTPYKIAVTGGTWEYLNNRLYFYNPFAQLEGQRLFTYVPLLDHLLAGARPAGSRRGRHFPRAARQRPQRSGLLPSAVDPHDLHDRRQLVLGGQGLAGSLCLDFRPGTAGLRDVPRLPAGVRRRDGFQRRSGRRRAAIRQAGHPPSRQRSAGRFQAPLGIPPEGEVAALRAWRQQSGGLAGGLCRTLRYRDGAFQALAAASQRTAPPVKVVLFGRVSPRQLQFFDKRAVVLPFVGYDAYAAALGALQPDILIAPLDRSRTSMSKCPVKYLDYSIAGAAGVYSDMPPYSQTIADGKTGLLVRGDDAASWAAAIDRLIEDEALRRSIVRAARRDIQEKYETAVVAPAFAEALRSVIEGHRHARSPLVEEPAAC